MNMNKHGGHHKRDKTFRATAKEIWGLHKRRRFTHATMPKIKGVTAHAMEQRLNRMRLAGLLFTVRDEGTRMKEYWITPKFEEMFAAEMLSADQGILEAHLRANAVGVQPTPVAAPAAVKPAEPAPAAAAAQPTAQELADFQQMQDDFSGPFAKIRQAEEQSFVRKYWEEGLKYIAKKFEATPALAEHLKELYQNAP